MGRTWVRPIVLWQACWRLSIYLILYQWFISLYMTHDVVFRKVELREFFCLQIAYETKQPQEDSLFG